MLLAAARILALLDTSILPAVFVIIVGTELSLSHDGFLASPANRMTL